MLLASAWVYIDFQQLGLLSIRACFMAPAKIRLIESRVRMVSGDDAHEIPRTIKLVVDWVDALAD